MSRRLRLERAAISLRSGSDSVGEIALTAGYDSPDAFARAFRHAYGSAPSEYRGKRRAQTELASPGGVHILATGGATELRPLPNRGPMNHEAIELPRRRMAAVRHIGPYSLLPAAFDTLCAWAVPRGVFAEPGAQTLTVVYDDPHEVPASKLRSDAAIFVSDDLEGEGEVKILEAPAGRYLRAVHLGAYEGLGDAWTRLSAAVHASEFTPRQGPTFEVYVGDPRTDSPESLRTDLYFPIS